MVAIPLTPSSQFAICAKVFALRAMKNTLLLSISQVLTWNTVANTFILHTGRPWRIGFTFHTSEQAGAKYSILSASVPLKIQFQL